MGSGWIVAGHGNHRHDWRQSEAGGQCGITGRWVMWYHFSFSRGKGSMIKFQSFFHADLNNVAKRLGVK
jgi:hypothetical protein